MITVTHSRSCDNCGEPKPNNDEVLCSKCKARNSEAKARAAVAKRTTYELIADFEETNNKPIDEYLPIVRGWLMDELEKRDRAAFDNWLESNEASPRKFYTGV
jgi:hypothetical protein